MVPGGYHVVEADRQVGKPHVIGIRAGQPFQIMTKLVGEETDSAGLKRRQAGAMHQRRGCKSFGQNGEWIALESPSVEFNLTVLGLQHAEWIDSEERIAAEPVHDLRA